MPSTQNQALAIPGPLEVSLTIEIRDFNFERQFFFSCLLAGMPKFIFCTLHKLQPSFKESTCKLLYQNSCIAITTHCEKPE